MLVPICSESKKYLDDQLHKDCGSRNVAPFAFSPTLVRGVNPVTLRSVAGAILRSGAIEVKCQSLSGPEPLWSWIAPHAIGFDVFLWHARAFCLTDGAFKDSLLSRILEIRGARESHVPAEEDFDWNTEIDLEIRPHPALSENQAEVIALDYATRPADRISRQGGHS